MPLGDLTFPLLPRRRLVGLAFGAMHSARRGTGSDVAGSRPYQPGDDVDTIDWGASARLSSARGDDAFIVREHFADEAPRVVIVCDRRPEMALFPPELPFLHKHEAVRAAAELIAESAAKARGFIGYLDYATGEEEPFWRRPQSHGELWEISERHLSFPAFRAPADNLARALDFLGGHRRSVPAGSFLFVLSDFLVSPPREAWTRAIERRWDIVPVVIQDPAWEGSFPPVGSVLVPLADAEGRVRPVRLRAGEAERRRAQNEERRERLLADFQNLGLEPILLSASDREHVLQAFLGWADERLFSRGQLA
ncbi:MAG: DUF58 domain-containing protein [Actinobacteria bacterium]|nr:DUF58 domain-containing protein [Actinomycetota bacterium]